MDWKAANILFADVKGYSSLSDKQMRVFSQKVLPVISDNIKDFSIRARNTWGDGIVLISDQIGDICEAALKLRDVFRSTNWKRLEMPKLDIRISIHHGEYVEGDDQFTGRTAFCGRTVVTAARIEPVTPPGKIWITDAAATMLRQHIESEQTDYFSIDPIGTITLPKKYGSISISGLRRSYEAALSPEELAQIKDAEALRIAKYEAIDKDQDLADLLHTSNLSSLKIVVGVVLKDKSVLLVKRRPNEEGLDWMFPSGKKFPNEDETYVIEKEVLEETGILCTVVGKINEVREHPVTKFHCVYLHLSPGDDLDIVNGDPIENEEVEWVEISDAIGLLGDKINPAVRDFLTSRGS